MTDSNCAWNFFRIVLSAIFVRHAPVGNKGLTGCFCPRPTPEVKAQMNVKDQLYRKAQKS